jgi:MSHA biogenesis protein MshQ
LLPSIVFAAAPAGEWWYTNFDHRVRITVPAGTVALANNYAIPLTFNHAALVSATESLASGNDVRIVYWNGTIWVELDRILDPESTWNSATTTIWFRTQAALAANTSSDNYYLYYGDAGAGSPPTDGESVFSLYDDFETGTAPDTGRWVRSNAAVAIAGGVLTLPGNSSDRSIRSVSTFGLSTIWEVRAAMGSLSPNNTNYYLAGDDDCNDFTFANYIRMQANNTANDTAVVSPGTTNPATANFTATAATSFQSYSFTREAAGAGRFFHNGTQVATFSGADQGAMCMFMTNAASTASHTMQYEWARVRPYRNPEPVIPALPTVENLPTPTPVSEYRLDQTTWTNAAGEVIDSGTSGLNMTSFGTPTTSNSSPPLIGDPGTCRYGNFNGTNQYLQVADNAAHDMAEQVSVTAWVYPRSLGSELRSIVSKDTNYEFHLNTAGQLYWWWGGAPQELTTAVTVPLNQWSHIAITYQSGMQRIYINGVLRASGTQTGNLTTNANPLQIGQDQGLAGRHWDGLIDEVRIYNVALSAAQVSTVRLATHPCSTVHHFDITHDNFGITCAAVETVTVAVHDSAHNNVASYNQQVTLDSQTGRGTWTLVTGTGSFTDATPNDGLATYTWPGGQATATFALDYRSAPSGTAPLGTLSFDIDVYQTSNTALRDDDSEGIMNFSPSGFVITSTLLSNPPPAVIPAFASPQIAGTAYTSYITAYGQTATDATCGVIEGYTGSKNVKFWSTYVDPGTGATRVAVNAVNAAQTEAASVAQAIVFTNGQASVPTNYPDAGRISLSIKDDTTGNPGLPTGIRGSATYVVRPASFVVSNIRRTSDNFANPAASAATGTVFIVAGRPFTATVTAVTSTGVATPNYGRETAPESVALTPSLVLPAGGNPSTVTAASGFATFTNGVSTGTDFIWPEVGIMRLTPHVADSDYLNVGDIFGTITGNIGRFIPHDFLMSANTPILQTQCTTGNFTYVGQPFGYAVPLVMTVTARAYSSTGNGTTTQNYRGAFFKITSATLTNKAYASTTGTLISTGIPGSGDPVIADLNNGSGTLSFSSGTGLIMQRTTTPVAPFNAQVSLSIEVRDTEGVAASAIPYTVGGAGGMQFTHSQQQRYGRIAFTNASGSELLNLPVPMRAEYFDSPATGFRVNSADACTTGITLAFANYGGNLGAGETCVLDTGSPGVSGLGCNVAGPALQQFRMAPGLGDFNLNLRAPGTGNGGTVTVTTVVPAWLRFDWNALAAGEENPSGIANFGLFQGESRRIYQTEK